MDQQDERKEENPALPGDGVFHPEQDKKLPADFRCGYVAIVGRPNVGKSTLMNALLGQKISIVTPKPQTTRHRLIGILSSESYQVVFLDTPGLLKPKYLLQEFMMDHATRAMEEADLLLFMVDARSPEKESWLEQDRLLNRVKEMKAPSFLLINKIDLIRKPQILPLIDSFSRMSAFDEIIPVSALKEDGMEDLLSTIIRSLPAHPPLYPLDIVSEHSERFLVSEIIREKIFTHCEQEIPYSTAVDVTEFREQDHGKTLIRAEIYVERTSQRGIVIGSKGARLKAIGADSRKEIEDFIQGPVFLDLHVKVRDEWRQKKTWLERLGYGS